MAIFKTTATGSGNISSTTSPGRPFALESVTLHLSAAGGANDLTVSLDANAGAEYDVVLFTQDMTSVTDLVWQPDRPIECAEDDKIVVTWTNASSRDYGLTVRWAGR